MILGVAHITLSCKNIESDSSHLQSRGYQIRFIEKDIPNSQSKRSFLQKYNPFHSIVYCETKNGVALELTDHGGIRGPSSSGYQVLFNGLFPGTEENKYYSHKWKSVWQDTLGCRNPINRLWPKFDTQFWYDPTVTKQEEIGVQAIIAPVISLKQSLSFWTVGLGCQEVSAGKTQFGQSWTRLIFRALIPTWTLDVVLVESDSCEASFMDSAGFPCVGFYCSDLKTDSQRLMKEKAVVTTGEFQVKINDRNLKIALLRGPNNELVELIEIEGSLQGR